MNLRQLARDSQRGKAPMETSQHGPRGADAALLRRALETLEAFRELLRALSPADIHAAVARASLETAGESHSVYWSVYRARHELLIEVVSTQLATFKQLVHARLEPETSGR